MALLAFCHCFLHPAALCAAAVDVFGFKYNRRECGIILVWLSCVSLCFSEIAFTHCRTIIAATFKRDGLRLLSLLRKPLSSQDRCVEAVWRKSVASCRIGEFCLGTWKSFFQVTGKCRKVLTETFPRRSSSRGFLRWRVAGVTACPCDRSSSLDSKMSPRRAYKSFIK